MPRFAIVIPNLNQSCFLPDALESLKYQSVPFAAAVMDGGSTDHFGQVVEKYKDIISYFQSRPDGGQACAIADGTGIVAGDIVSWLNADDYYFPDTLAKVAAVFEEYPEVDVIYGDAIHVQPDGAFISYFPAIEEFHPGLLPFSCFICQPACFVRRSAYDAAGGINPALKYTMDWDLWCRLAANGATFKYVHDVLAAVRYYPETKTLSGDKKRYYEIWRISRRYGHRMLPVSWPGFYRFDLSFKKDKSAMERLIYNVLEKLRKFKKKVFEQNQKTLYGFYPWQSKVDGQCLIQFPWYKNQAPGKLHVDVFPSDAAYLVDFDSCGSEKMYSKKGKLSIPLPGTENHCYRLRMKCLDRKQWAAVDFSF